MTSTARTTSRADHAGYTMTFPTRFVITQHPVPNDAELPVEFCEHKGVGHPDSLCDGVAEAVSRALCRTYRAAYGCIQHYNVDKALLIGGQSSPRFGGGQLIMQPRLIVCGRATPLRETDMGALVVAAARDYLASVLRCDSRVIAVESAVRAGSPNLTRVVGAGETSPRANDTSFGCGFAPPTRLEQAVLQIADALHSDEFRRTFPAAGDDYKVMGSRIGNDIDLTIALAFVDREVFDRAEYVALKIEVIEYLRRFIDVGARIVLNALDDARASDESGLYLTVTGLSAEHGDDGQVGRGNRANGLITPQRTMSLEATAGKNAAAHVGKLYNVLAFEIAAAIVRAHPCVRDASVQLLSTIGSPAAEPAIVAIALHCDEPRDEGIEAAVRGIAAAMLGQIQSLTDRFVEGTVRVF